MTGSCQIKTQSWELLKIIGVVGRNYVEEFIKAALCMEGQQWHFSYGSKGGSRVLKGVGCTFWHCH